MGRGAISGLVLGTAGALVVVILALVHFFTGKNPAEVAVRATAAAICEQFEPGWERCEEVAIGPKVGQKDAAGGSAEPLVLDEQSEDSLSTPGDPADESREVRKSPEPNKSLAQQAQSSPPPAVVLSSEFKAAYGALAKNPDNAEAVAEYLFELDRLSDDQRKLGEFSEYHQYFSAAERLKQESSTKVATAISVFRRLNTPVERDLTEWLELTDAFFQSLHAMNAYDRASLTLNFGHTFEQITKFLEDSNARVMNLVAHREADPEDFFDSSSAPYAAYSAFTQFDHARFFDGSGSCVGDKANPSPNELVARLEPNEPVCTLMEKLVSMAQLYMCACGNANLAIDGEWGANSRFAALRIQKVASRYYPEIDADRLSISVGTMVLDTKDWNLCESHDIGLRACRNQSPPRTAN